MHVATIVTKQHSVTKHRQKNGDWEKNLQNFAHCVGLSLDLLGTPRGCSMLRVTPLVFKRERFPVLWWVLIRAL